MAPTRTCEHCGAEYAPVSRERGFPSRWDRRRFCTRRCGLRHHQGRGPAPRPVADRLWPKVDRNGPVSEYRPDLGPCWLWTAYLDRGGYGRLCVAGVPLLAPRLAYEIAVGPIPEGLQIDHLCRVRACVNPTHLEPVTPAENSRRGVEARRARHA